MLTPPTGMLCVCVCVGMCVWWVHLNVSVRKKLQKIHMHPINADDNTPEVWKKTNGNKNKQQYNYSEILEWCHILNEHQKPCSWGPTSFGYIYCIVVYIKCLFL